MIKSVLINREYQQMDKRKNGTTDIQNADDLNENLKTRKGYSNVLARSLAQPQFSMRIKPMY